MCSEYVSIMPWKNAFALPWVRLAGQDRKLLKSQYFFEPPLKVPKTLPRLAAEGSAACRYFGSTL
jgi:hypothetical protein